MTLPEWTKPGIYGAIVGAIILAIVGLIGVDGRQAGPLKKWHRTVQMKR